MKKSNTKLFQQDRRRKRRNQQRRMKRRAQDRITGALTRIPEWTLGVDLGDEYSHWCLLDRNGEVVVEESVRTEGKEFRKLFEKLPGSRIVMEVGTHSPWVSRCAEQVGRRYDCYRRFSIAGRRRKATCWRYEVGRRWCVHERCW